MHYWYNLLSKVLFLYFFLYFYSGCVIKGSRSTTLLLKHFNHDPLVCRISVVSFRLWLDEPRQHPADGGQHADWELGPEYGRRRQQLLTSGRTLPQPWASPLLPVLQHLLQGVALPQLGHTQCNKVGFFTTTMSHTCDKVGFLPQLWQTRATRWDFLPQLGSTYATRFIF